MRAMQELALRKDLGCTMPQEDVRSLQRADNPPHSPYSRLLPCPTWVFAAFGTGGGNPPVRLSGGRAQPAPDLDRHRGRHHPGDGRLHHPAVARRGEGERPGRIHGLPGDIAGAARHLPGRRVCSRPPSSCPSRSRSCTTTPWSTSRRKPRKKEAAREGRASPVECPMKKGLAGGVRCTPDEGLLKKS